MSIKNLKPQMGRFKQGYFKVLNAEKYIGDPAKIIFRSSWELKFMRYCDRNPYVLKWSSEPIPIPYINPIDEKQHTYNVDFYVRYVHDSGEKDYLVEIKPESQHKNPPKRPAPPLTHKKLQNYNRSLKTYIVNNAKFDSAKAYTALRGYEFLVVDDDWISGKSETIFS